MVIGGKGLHSNLSSELSPRDPLMDKDAALLREEYLGKEIDVIVRVKGTENPANPLSKPLAGETLDILDWMLTEGRLPIGVDDIRQYESVLEGE